MGALASTWLDVLLVERQQCAINQFRAYLRKLLYSENRQQRLC